MSLVIAPTRPQQSPHPPAGRVTKGHKTPESRVWRERTVKLWPVPSPGQSKINLLPDAVTNTGGSDGAAAASPVVNLTARSAALAISPGASTSGANDPGVR